MSETKNQEENRIDCDNSTDQEIEEWIVLTRKVLIVLEDEDKNAYNKIYQDFLLDLQDLLKVGRITVDDYEEIIDSL